MALDESKTAPFTLVPAGATGARAVLLLHGFTGSPWEVRLLGEALAARGFLVHAPRLPGHGSTPEAMEGIGWADWVSAAESAFDELAKAHRHVSVVGLSMGALLGVIVAARRVDQVRGLVLLAPVARLRAPAARLLRLVRKTALPRLLPAWLEKRTIDLELDDERAAAPILPRYPLASVLDLFRVQDLAEALAPQVRCPALLIAAASDHVVDFRGVEGLQRRLCNSRLVVLQRGFHIIPRDRDRALAATETAELLDGLPSGDEGGSQGQGAHAMAPTPSQCDGAQSR